MKKALILLGCPESPSQTPLAVYATYKLQKMGFKVTIASTPSAMKLIEVSDPEKHYIQDKIDIEQCLDGLEPNSFDLLLGFVHKDAAVSFFVTFYHLLQVPAIALVFEKDLDELEKLITEVEKNTDAIIVSARAYHNPTPLRVRLDRALKELSD